MAAVQESRFPMERKLARLAAVSSESLANAVAAQARSQRSSGPGDMMAGMTGTTIAAGDDVMTLINVHVTHS
jgi:predicted aconitase